MASSYNDMKDKVVETKDRFKAVAPELSDSVDMVKKEAAAQVDRLSDAIRNKPIQSAAIAAGVGFLFAVLARR